MFAMAIYTMDFFRALYWPRIVRKRLKVTLMCRARIDDRVLPVMHRKSQSTTRLLFVPVITEKSCQEQIPTFLVSSGIVRKLQAGDRKVCPHSAGRLNLR